MSHISIDLPSHHFTGHENGKGCAVKHSKHFDVYFDPAIAGRGLLMVAGGFLVLFLSVSTHI